MTEMFLKHRYGLSGLLTYLDLSMALSAGIVVAYNVSFPESRSITSSSGSSLFQILFTLVSLVMAVLTLRNTSFGLGQDFADGIIITFLQMRRKDLVFLTFYAVDVILPALFFLVSCFLVFILSSFDAGPTWELLFLLPFLFLANLSYVITILVKRPFRSFVGSVVVAIFSLFFFFFGGLVNQLILVPMDLVSFALAYFLFKGVSV